MTRAELLAELKRIDGDESRSMELASVRYDSGGLPDCWVAIVRRLFALWSQLPQIIAALQEAERLEEERDKAVAILKAGRLAYCNMQNEGANLIDFLNLWLDQEKQKTARLEEHVAQLEAACKDWKETSQRDQIERKRLEEERDMLRDAHGVSRENSDENLRFRDKLITENKRLEAEVERLRAQVASSGKDGIAAGIVIGATFGKDAQ